MVPRRIQTTHDQFLRRVCTYWQVLASGLDISLHHDSELQGKLFQEIEQKILKKFCKSLVFLKMELSAVIYSYKQILLDKDRKQVYSKVYNNIKICKIA